MKSLGRILRELREDHDLKQKDIAKILGTSQQIYSNYENDKSEIPLHHLVTLADFYHLSLDSLTNRTFPVDLLNLLNQNFHENMNNANLLLLVDSLPPHKRESLLDYILFLKSTQTS